MEVRAVPKPGITWRSLLIIIYAAILLGPLNIFLYVHAGGYMLTAGPGFLIGAPAVFITMLLFTEISRMFGAPLTKQELFIILNLMGLAMSQALFISLLMRGYFRISPIAWIFIEPLTGEPLPKLMPLWFAPPYGSPAYYLRTFLHIDWLMPIATVLLGALLYTAYEIGLGFLCAHIFVIEEKLPFPYAPVQSEAIVTMAERDPERMRVFALSAVLSMVWSSITFGVPEVIGGVYGISAGMLTFTDLTPYIDKFLPGAVFGVVFTPFPYTMGFMQSLSSIIWILIGSYALWFLGNALTLKIPSPLFAEFQQEYRTGMGIGYVMSRADMWIWTSFLMGAGLSVAVVSLLRGWKYLTRAIKSLRRLRSTEAGYLPLPAIIALWIGGGVGFILLIHILCPQFPLWALMAFIMGFTFLSAMINARGIGEVGFGVSVPYLNEVMILSSGYRGADIWFSPVSYAAWGASATSYTYLIKVAELTEARPLDYFKGLIFILPLTWLMSFLVVSTFWTIAPIPSSIFPASVYMWPAYVSSESFRIINFQRFYKPPIIASGFIIMAGLTIAKTFIKSPLFNPIALLVGFGISPPFSNALAIGYLIGEYVLKKRFGAEWWDRYKGTALAGIACGYGIVAGVSAILILVSKALWYTYVGY